MLYVDRIRGRALRWRGTAVALVVATGAAGVGTIEAAPEAAAQEQPCQPATWVLATGDPAVTEGAVSVRVDGVGRFGTSYNPPPGASFNPPGPAAANTSVFSSDVLTDFDGVMDACRIDGLLVASATGAGVVTRWTAGRFAIELTQSVAPSGVDGSGAVLTQAYRLANLTTTAIPVRLVRHLDGDLLFDDTLSDGGAGTIDGAALYEFDSSDDPLAPSTYVGIGGSFDRRNVPDRWTIQPYPYLDDLIEAGDIPTEHDGEISGDNDGDRIVDEVYDVTLSQQWDGIVPAAGESVFTTVTRFGFLPPADATEPRVARFDLNSGDLVYPEQLGLTTSASRQLTGRNTGTAPVTVRSVAPVGPAAGDVVISEDSCSRTTLAPGGTCAVSVALRPTAPGVREAAVEFDTTAALAPQRVAVRGAGSTPSLLLNPGVVKPGQPAEAIGTSFPPGRTATLAWVDSSSLVPGGFVEPINLVPQPTGEDGTFRSWVMVFPNSRLGGRVLTASIDGFNAGEPLLVAMGSAQGPDFVARR